MRKTIVLLALLLAAPIAAVSQVITCHMHFEGPGEIAPISELKKPFEHSVALPSHVLALLSADETNAGKFEVCPSRGNLPQIPPEWFLATEIKLADDELPGLIVKAANTCLWDGKPGEEVGGFWVFRQAPQGYQLVLTAHTQALQVLDTRTGGYPDLCTGQIHDGSTIILQTLYTFGKGKYVTDMFYVSYD